MEPRTRREKELMRALVEAWAERDLLRSEILRYRVLVVALGILIILVLLWR